MKYRGIFNIVRSLVQLNRSVKGIDRFGNKTDSVYCHSFLDSGEMGQIVAVSNQFLSSMVESLLSRATSRLLY